MSVQLVLYPQNYEGVYTDPLFQEYVSDGQIFSLLNNYSGYDAPTSSTNPAYDAGSNAAAISAWKRFRSTNPSGAYGLVDMPTNIGGQLILYSSNTTTYSSSSGVYQLINNLSAGVQYEINIELTQASSNSGHLIIGNPLLASANGEFMLGNINHTFTTAATGTLSLAFTANTFQEFLMIEYRNYNGDAIKIDSISIKPKSTTPSTIFNVYSDGQVICDLYEEEDIPLSLSIDDFKNVAEKVQSYSKDFNLPATKRNNKIFSHLFDVTRVQDAFSFNPYVKTQCILKQNGYNIFKGYLRLIDISNQDGEISYNVNLYSEPLVLKEVLENRKIKDLDLSELDHLYDKTNIKNSWYDNAGITLTKSLNPNSFAFDGSLTNPYTHTTVLKYPFVNWKGDYNIDTNDNIILDTFEDAFRPFINCKYLIDKIIFDTNFTYESDFLNGVGLTTEDVKFKDMFMDFNWGSGNSPSDRKHSGGSDLVGADATITTTFAPVVFDSESYSSQPDFGYNSSTAIFTAVNDNSEYYISYKYTFRLLAAGVLEGRYAHRNSSGNLVGSGIINAFTVTNSTFVYSGNFTEILNTGDTLSLEVKSSTSNSYKAIKYDDPYDKTYSNGIISLTSIANSVLLNTQRGDLGQWEFLRSFVNMFNLIILQDKNNPNNLIIEPYKNIFIKNTSGTTLFDRGIIYDWTDKIDETQIKLTPLELPKTTNFRYEEDEAYPNNYYQSITNTEYGSYKFSNPDMTLLTGEEEIMATPFSATVIKPMADYLPQFIVPTVYSSNDDATEFESYDNNPRILFKVSSSPFEFTDGTTYYIPQQNGTFGEDADKYLRFSHTSSIPSTISDKDLNFGEIQLLCGSTPVNNLYNIYWSPYYNELYNPDTKYMTLKVNLNASDINQFNFYDKVMIKNKEYRVNKIDYKPNDLSTVQFILIG